jgi:hypothetical protein
LDSGGGGDQLDELLEDGLRSLADVLVLVGGSQEVGDASDNAYINLRLQLRKNLLEQLDPVAGPGPSQDQDRSGS